MSTPQRASATEVERHKTAIPRTSVSAPIFLLQSGGVITDKTTVLDYGCGKGNDLEALKQAGINAYGWDPHFAPNTDKLVESDVVNLGFVLNVIEDRSEREEALRKAFGYARQCLAVSVMLIGKGDLRNSRPYKDGFITSRRTFQKYYSQGELREFVASTLDVEPIAAGPGIFFVFKDELAEQRFLFRRQIGFRSSTSRTSPIVRTEHSPTSKAPTGTVKSIVKDLAGLIRELGRYPDEGELPTSLRKRIAKSKHGLSYLSNLSIQEVDSGELEQVAARRMGDLSLFFALNAFGQRPPYCELPPEMQRDVRAFFGSHQRAIAEGQALLFSIGDSERLLKDAQEALNAGIGRLDDAKFQFHIRDLPRLSPALRGYVAIGERLVGDLSEATLLRIHIDSKKLSTLYCPDFETSPLPRITQRVKVEFQTFDVTVVDHTQGGRVKLLFLRSKYLTPDHPHLDEQKKFDDRILEIETLDLSGEGPDLQSFSKAITNAAVSLPRLS
ncbi:DNA phosphorothioation-associated putative methyltransferase [Vannielia litorea]|uniref:DNA phosphorothioation-associated putative methyltransferase n=1 Tax=Vannielia litorea TaxID=1217970 RepID=UPI001BCF3272|nr:DNA phosphorothioation-associated putative methyltransferase [Vannielia litorea]MBS8225761.1 DNA phosphorothioation-associated putative methyltransferase [Vannielia litorea]